MGALVVAGVFPPGFERIGWMVVTLVCAFAIGRARVENAFWHGVVVGFVVGALATLVEGIFFGSYIKNNAWVVDKFTNQPAGFDLRIFIMMLVPFIGLAGGLVTGFVTYLVDRAMQARRESP
jgi:D-alanyl-lipoteichoic acid acyltransferase DltB (MBOAT superfamily)